MNEKKSNKNHINSNNHISNASWTNIVHIGSSRQSIYSVIYSYLYSIQYAFIWICFFNLIEMDLAQVETSSIL